MANPDPLDSLAAAAPAPDLLAVKAGGRETLDAAFSDCVPGGRLLLSDEAAPPPFVPAPLTQPEGPSSTLGRVPAFPRVGEMFADCLLLAELGSGAAGRVFLATQPALADRPVVLKMTPCRGGEHLTLARLPHTHVVPLYFVQDFTPRNLRVLCMPYLGGDSLAGLLELLRPVAVRSRTGRHLVEAVDRVQARRPVPPPPANATRAWLERASWVDAVCWIGACLADALHHAHQRGLVHLDVKPSNVLIAADGTPLLLDFHLARAPVQSGGRPPDWIGGTPAYMPPEQKCALEAVRARRPVLQAVDGRADVYGLGLVLYEAMGGRLPLDGKPSILHKALSVSPGLADVLARCLEPDAARRYPDAQSLADDLRRHLARQPLRGVRNRSLRERWVKWRSSQPAALPRLLLKVGGVAVLLVGSLLAFAHIESRRCGAEQALTEARDQLSRGRANDASRVLDQGFAAVVGLPGMGSVAERMEELRARVGQAVRADELRSTVDELRLLHDARLLPPNRLRKYHDRCAQLWADRAAYLEGPDDDVAGRCRDDLADLALLWSGLPGLSTGAARRLLDEAAREFGSGPGLELQRSLLDNPAAPDRPPSPPRTAWEHFVVGRTLLRAGRAEDAAGYLDRAAGEMPDSLWPQFEQGVCAFRLGRHEEAVAAFRVCTALAPAAAPCFFNRALAEAAAGRADDALRDYDRCLTLAPSLASAWLNRGVLRLQQGHPREARADLTQALKSGADPATTHYNLALACRAAGDVDAAVEHCRLCLGYAPDRADARALSRQLSSRDR